MGTLRDLYSEDKNVHLLVTNSNMMELFVYDTLKERCGATLESVYEVSKASEFRDTMEYVNMQPYLADRWLFVIEYGGVKGILKKHLPIFEAESAVFLIKVKNYAEFKEFKELYPKVNDLYLSWVRESDVDFLFRGFELPSKFISFVAKSYGKEPDKILTLRNELKNGAEINSTKDIVKLCGASASSVVGIAMNLLKEPSTSVKGINARIRNRIQESDMLIDGYGVSTFKNFLTGTIRDIMNIKMLYMEGAIYNAIRGLPEVYDEKKLSRYNFYLDRIVSEIPYERISRCYLMLVECGRWNSRSDMLSFMYEYYGGSVNADISEL